jgi:hypothetical protein
MLEMLRLGTEAGRSRQMDRSGGPRRHLVGHPIPIGTDVGIRALTDQQGPAALTDKRMDVIGPGHVQLDPKLAFGRLVHEERHVRDIGPARRWHHEQSKGPVPQQSQRFRGLYFEGGMNVHGHLSHGAGTARTVAQCWTDEAAVIRLCARNASQIRFTGYAFSSAAPSIRWGRWIGKRAAE